MSKIIIYPHYCQLQEDDSIFLKELDKELSYFIQSAIFSKAFKMKRWDGIQHLLKGNLIFPSGLYERVCLLYKNKNKDYEITDLRAPKSLNTPIDISKKLAEMNKVPFYYQEEMVKIAQKNDRGVFRAATGSGKSIAIALITASFGKSSNIFVVGKDLLYQMHKLFSQIFDQEIGIIGDGLCQIAKINIVSIWTAGIVLNLKSNEIAIDLEEDEEEKLIDIKKYEDIKKMLSSSKVNIFDECHSCANATIQAINNNIAPEHLYGFSASPTREDGLDLLCEAVLGKIIYNLTATTLINSGHLVKPIIKFIDVPVLDNDEKEKPLQHYKSIYKQYIIENDTRNAKVILATQKLVEQGYKTLVLYNSLSHGKYLFEQLNKILPCALLSGKDDIIVRDKAKTQLENGGIKAILASSIFDVGLDLPCLSGLVLAGGGKSKIKSLQRLGRALRVYPGKRQTAVIDFVDNAKFLLDHSKARYKIYTSEDAFEVHIPQYIKWKKSK